MKSQLKAPLNHDNIVPKCLRRPNWGPIMKKSEKKTTNAVERFRGSAALNFSSHRHALIKDELFSVKKDFFYFFTCRLDTEKYISEFGKVKFPKFNKIRAFFC